MIDSHYDASIAIAPEPQSGVWMGQYATIVLALVTPFRSLRSSPGGPARVHRGRRCDRAALRGARRPAWRRGHGPRSSHRTALFGFAVAEVFTWIGVGFAGPSALIPCVLPVLASLFVGGRAPYRVLIGSLAAYVAVGALRVSTGVETPSARRAIGRSACPGPTGSTSRSLWPPSWPPWCGSSAGSSRSSSRSFAAVASARSTHEVEVRLRAAAEAALEKALQRAQETRRAEASGLLVAGVVHDLRNHLSVLQLSSSRRGRASGRRRQQEDDAVAQVRSLCGEAGRVAGDLLRAARPRLAQACPRCFVARRDLGGGKRTGWVAAFGLSNRARVDAGRGPRSRRGSHTFACTVLGVAAAAGVASARGSEHSPRRLAQPTSVERSMLSRLRGGRRAEPRLRRGRSGAREQRRPPNFSRKAAGRMLLSPDGSSSPDPPPASARPRRPPTTEDEDG